MNKYICRSVAVVFTDVVNPMAGPRTRKKKEEEGIVDARTVVQHIL